MPHKHKRRQNDTNAYDLPPTLIAKPLPARDASKPARGKGKVKGKPHPKEAKAPAKAKPNAATRRKTDLDDDTPREFRRLMQFQARSQNQKSSQKRKRDSEDSSDDSDDDTPALGQKSSKRKQKNKRDTNQAQTKPEISGEKPTSAPKILPGEKLADFAARVDREMPLSEMKRSNNSTAPGDLPKIKDHRTTKHEKHLRRLQAQWREDEARLKEREAAEREEREEEMEEQSELWKQWEMEAGKKKKKNPNAGSGGKKKNGGEGGIVDDDGPDPWAKLNKKRAAVNPFDVAQEPPQLKKPKELFKVRGGAKVDVANVPASVGSLRRREELATERRNIVEEYRRLMAEKRQ
ncbi:hypothetical protein BJX61DRAFT_372420 [Aspergillus egyptiacus]|nr:hypothetical protein BJX61DRAFT_372420 [Aspergillus egyptiacus]